MTPDGLDAVMRLAGGDMRKCLNVMQASVLCAASPGSERRRPSCVWQACHLAYPETNEHNVYLCTGQPMPRDVTNTMNWLLNDPFEEAYASASAAPARPPARPPAPTHASGR
jgi:replication factor C subunit 3/5